MAAKRRIDYDRIEPGWRAGILSPHQLAAAYTEETGEPCSHAAIIKHFRKLNIPRDLSQKIHAKAESMVTTAMVTGKVTKETIARDQQIIDEGALVVATVKLTQRKDIARSRRLVMAMMAELEESCGTENADRLSKLGEVMRNPDEYGRDKLNDLYQTIVSLPSRAKTMRDLASSLATLIDKEREAFNIGAKTGNGEDAPGSGPSARALTDTERAVRLSRLLGSSPEIAAALVKRVPGTV